MWAGIFDVLLEVVWIERVMRFAYFHVRLNLPHALTYLCIYYLYLSSWFNLETVGFIGERSALQNLPGAAVFKLFYQLSCERLSISKNSQEACERSSWTSDRFRDGGNA